MGDRKSGRMSTQSICTTCCNTGVATMMTILCVACCSFILLFFIYFVHARPTSQQRGFFIAPSQQCKLFAAAIYTTSLLVLLLIGYDVLRDISTEKATNVVKLRRNVPTHPLHLPSNAYKILSNAFGLWDPGFHRTQQSNKRRIFKTTPSTETADALVQAKMADRSWGSHLIRHSPRCTSGTFFTKFPDPHESHISVEMPISNRRK